MFHAHKVVAWHHYGREGNQKHWDDAKKWGDRNQHSYSRVRKLFGIGGEKFEEGECKDKYNFGTKRTLAQYEEYAGVRFKDKKIQQYTIDNKLAPNPTIKKRKEYNKSFKGYFKICIDIGFERFASDDYEFWAVAFFNDKDEEVHRQDADQDEIKGLLDKKNGYVKLWRWFNTDDNITKWRVWPCSKKNGFEDAIEQYIG